MITATLLHHGGHVVLLAGGIVEQVEAGRAPGQVGEGAATATTTGAVSSISSHHGQVVLLGVHVGLLGPLGLELAEVELGEEPPIPVAALHHGGTELPDLLLGLLPGAGGGPEAVGGVAKVAEAGGNLLGQVLQLLGPVVGGATATGTSAFQLHHGILLLVAAVAAAVAVDIVGRRCHGLHPLRLDHGPDAGKETVGNAPNGEVANDAALVVAIHGGIELVVEPIELAEVVRLALDDPALEVVELGRHLDHVRGLGGVLPTDLIELGADLLNLAIGPPEGGGAGLDLLGQDGLGRSLRRDLGFVLGQDRVGLVGLAVVAVALGRQAGELGVDGRAIDHGGCRHGWVAMMAWGLGDEWYY
mmetsp:Transcript_637/g.1821  ORF Transcript_637/g.1821 Transcript_637/m.1821 type:complete len:359 (-) Transcript_637:32-1108(-)